MPADLAGPAPSLKELISLLKLDDKSEGMLFKMLKRRENLGSTGIGRGIAIPHCRSLVVNKLRVAFGRKTEGVDFRAIDEKPVNFFFLIVAPPLEVSNQYLPVLGKIAQFSKEPDVPQRLLTILQRIEQDLGRRRDGARWGPRPIDLDILLWEGEVIADANLQVPHLELHKRRFALEPLVELAPHVKHPVLGVPVKELLARLDPQDVRRLLATQWPDLSPLVNES